MRREVEKFGAKVQQAFFASCEWVYSGKALDDWFWKFMFPATLVVAMLYAWIFFQDAVDGIGAFSPNLDIGWKIFDFSVSVAAAILAVVLTAAVTLSLLLMSARWGWISKSSGWVESRLTRGSARPAH